MQTFLMSEYSSECHCQSGIRYMITRICTDAASVPDVQRSVGRQVDIHAGFKNQGVFISSNQYPTATLIRDA